MRLKQKVALLLAGIVTIGSVGFMNPVEVKAATNNSFTITVPANVNIYNNGWNSIGTVNVAGTIATDKKITVSIATANDFKLKNETNEVAYTIKKTSNAAAAITSLDFAANDVNATGGASQSIGAYVESFTGKPAGNYTDTITFTAKLEVSKDFEMTNVSGKVMKTVDLGTPVTFTVNGKTYYAYNDFIWRTAGSSWNDAVAFVNLLNENEYDEHKDWMLINDVVVLESGRDYESAIGAAWRDKYIGTEVGVVDFLWTSVGLGADVAYYFYVDGGDCSPSYWTDSYWDCGFLVLRGSN